MIFVSAGLLAPSAAMAQGGPEQNYLDHILEKRPFTPEETSSLEQDANSGVDVRDLVLYLNDQPLSATFGSATSTAYYGQGTVQVPIYFSEPVTGDLRVDLGGTARAGEAYEAFGAPVAGFEDIQINVSVNAERSTILTIPLLQSATDFQNESQLVLTLKPLANYSFGGIVERNGGPQPSGFTTHTVVLRTAPHAWRGLLEFPANSGFRQMPVHFFLDEDNTVEMRVGEGESLQTPSIARGRKLSTGGLELWSAITGILPLPGQPAEAGWQLEIRPDQSIAEPVPGFFYYTAVLQLQDYPLAGETRVLSFPLSLVAID